MNLVCGDALQELRRLESESVDSFITDPPYGIAYQSTGVLIERARCRKLLGMDNHLSGGFSMLFV